MNQIRMEATMDKKIAIPFDEPSRPELESCRATVNRWDMIDFESDFRDSLIWVRLRRSNQIIASRGHKVSEPRNCTSETELHAWSQAKFVLTDRTNKTPFHNLESGFLDESLKSRNRDPRMPNLQ